MKLQTNDQTVIELMERYKEYPSVRTALLELFPFPVQHDLKDLSSIKPGELSALFERHDMPDLIEIRGSGDYKDRAFYLNPHFRWRLIVDAEGYTCLGCMEKN